jgi:mono/diheme cytochrome c family protein
VFSLCIKEKRTEVRRRALVVLVAGVCVLAALIWTASRVTISATAPPGRLETWAATRVKTWMIGRAARKVPPFARPTGLAVAAGGMRFGGECAACHGTDGRSPTDIGRAMYPPAMDLGSPAVQAWSDRELFWIVKHGIRLTGMPGFGRELGDDEIRQLVAYVRTLAKNKGT